MQLAYLARQAIFAMYCFRMHWTIQWSPVCQLYRCIQQVSRKTCAGLKYVRKQSISRFTKSRIYFELWLIIMSNVIENGFPVSNDNRNLAYILNSSCLINFTTALSSIAYRKKKYFFVSFSVRDTSLQNPVSRYNYGHFSVFLQIYILLVETINIRFLSLLTAIHKDKMKEI